MPVNLRREKVEVFDRLRLTGCFLVLRSRFFISREYSLVIRLRNLEESPVVIFGETRTVCRWLLASSRLVWHALVGPVSVLSDRFVSFSWSSSPLHVALFSPLLSSQANTSLSLSINPGSVFGPVPCRDVVWCGVMTGRRVLLPHQRAGDHVQDGGRVRVQPQEGVRGGTLKLYE